jgi:undecaprenyl-diphosphatase
MPSLDLSIVSWIVSTLRTPWLDPVMLGASAAGYHGIAFVVIGLGVALARRGWTLMAWWRLLLAVVLAAVLVDHVLKPLLPRDRPYVADAEHISPIGPRHTNSSMPSGHAAVAVAGAIGLSLVWRRLRGFAWALAALVVFSRMYLGVHYPTDLLVGMIAGWACAFVATVGIPGER